MLFGDRETFAIEVHADEIAGTQVPSVWGRMRIFLNGSSVGDINELHCGLGGTVECFKSFLPVITSLWKEEFDSLSDRDLWNFLDEKLYGFRGEVEIEDKRSIAEIKRDAEKYGMHCFLTNWGEQFDGDGKCFMLAPPDGQLKVLKWNRDSKSADSFVFARKPAIEAIQEFLSWFASLKVGTPVDSSAKLKLVLMDAVEAYGSLSNPNYTFVAAKMREGLYDREIRQLRDSFSLKESTDLNNDVARFLSLEEKWVLAISLVGAYAILARTDSDNRWTILGWTRRDMDESEREILELLRKNGLCVLSSEDLFTPVEFSPVNSGESRVALYRVLFEDREPNDFIKRDA